MSKRGKTTFWLGLSVIGWLCVLSFAGCGVKGPPKPLWQRPVPRVVDLAGVVQAPWVKLTWSLSEPLHRTQAKHAKFVIYGAKSSLEMEVCQGCLQVFEKMATIGYVDRDDNRYELQVPVESDYHYVFKVNLVMPGGTGPDSDLVDVDVWSRTPVTD